MVLPSYGLCYINLHKLFMKSIFALMLYTKDFHMSHYFWFSQMRTYNYQAQFLDKVCMASLHHYSKILIMY